MAEGQFDFLYPSLEEIHEPEEAPLIGELPEWMHGASMIRTGPGLFEFNDDVSDKNCSSSFTVNHFLDGYAMLTRFQISKDSVKYDRKFLLTNAYTKAKQQNRPVISEFGTKGQKPDPTKSLLSRLLPSLEISDNCNVSMFNIGDEIFAAADTCFFRNICPETLECGEKFDTSKLVGLNLWSCHPMPDKDGYIYNIGTSFITGLKYNVVKIPIPTNGQTAKDVLKKAKILSTIPSSNTFCASPCHSFGKTESYVIMIEQPLVIVAQKVLASLIHKSCNRDFMEYRPEMKNKFHVIDKHTGQRVKTDYISSEAFFFLHIINCYEFEDEIVLDLCAFPNANCIDLSLKDFKNGFEGRIEDLAQGRRYVIPLTCHDKNGNEFLEGTNLIHKVKTTATAVKESKRNVIVLTHEPLTEQGIEVPIVHSEFSGKPYLHFFGGGPRAVGPYKSAIVKFNVETKESLVFRLKEGEFLSEPIVVGNPKGRDDDDGVLISCLTRAIPGEKCGIVFIDAKNMLEIARAEFDNFVPLAIHGIYLPKKS